MDKNRLGFGSFVEKNVAPFSSAVPEFNCASDNPNCAPPYSFYHQQNLDNITAQQFSKVNNLSMFMFMVILVFND